MGDATVIVSIILEPSASGFPRTYQDHGSEDDKS
jgi:hypothetical protein